MVPVFVTDARRAVSLGALALSLTAASCSSDDAAKPPHHDGASDAAAHGDGGVTPAPEGSPYATLEEWHLFTDAKAQVPASGVIPYDVIAQLFSDYAFKRRFVYVPPGKKIGYSATDRWNLPVGTILVKTFSYLTDGKDPKNGERLLETRLLIHETDGWAPHTYVWNAAQTSAALTTGGATIDSRIVTPSGKTLQNGYLVPSEDDCRTCHGRLGYTDTLGGRTRQLDRDHDYGNGPENQIDHLAKLGLFDVTPEAPADRVHLVDPFGDAPLSERARSYLDGNCGHCHQRGEANASQSGYWVDYPSTDPVTASDLHWGVCKQPTSATGSTCGLWADVYPGRPDQSILVCRIESQQARARMPPVGRTLVHDEGVALLRDWIAGLPGAACNAPGGEDAGGGGGHDAGLRDAASPNDAASRSDAVSPSDAAHSD
ncbi:MAG TPA: hypothetical protein VHE30_19540 [Polyangiaceae bacterium]|nr:hypothetical protein [Polyangiaceae bacterium]